MELKTQRAIEGTVLLTAPVDGRIEFEPPEVFAGELEVYDHGAVLAVVYGESSVAVRAPVRGFVSARYAPEGQPVRSGAILLAFRSA